MAEAARPLKILFTDIDGTLLDHHTYQPGPALAALHRLRMAGVLVVPATAKTPAELRPLSDQLELADGWIAENGAAIGGTGAALNGWHRVLGLDRASVLRGLREAAAAASAVVRGFADLDDGEVAALTGLDLVSAARARDRQWSETFQLSRGDPGALRSQLAGRGLRFVRGSRFFTATGNHDKGTAIRIFVAELRARGFAPQTWAVGDAPNDAEMLAAVDHPMQVRFHDGGYARLDVAGIIRCDGVGPLGWVQAAQQILAAPPAESQPPAES